MGWQFVAVLAALGLAACADYPRDAEGTLDAIRERGTIRLGVSSTAATDRAVLERFVASLSQATEARMQTLAGPEEELLAKLEHGDLDLVAGQFVDDSPWLADTALIEPLTSRRAGDRKIGLALVARNGENAWIGLVERTVRDVRAEQ